MGQRFEPHTFQVNFDPLKLFKLPITAGGICIHPKVYSGFKNSKKIQKSGFIFRGPSCHSAMLPKKNSCSYIESKCDTLWLDTLHIVVILLLIQIDIKTNLIKLNQVILKRGNNHGPPKTTWNSKTAL